MAQQFWQILQATTTKELLFRCQTIITAIRLRRLVNLHLGIMLWHQGEEPGLCSVPVCQIHHRGRVDTGADLTLSGASPALKSLRQLFQSQHPITGILRHLVVLYKYCTHL